MGKKNLRSRIRKKSKRKSRSRRRRGQSPRKSRHKSLRKKRRRSTRKSIRKSRRSRIKKSRRKNNFKVFSSRGDFAKQLSRISIAQRRVNWCNKKNARGERYNEKNNPDDCKKYKADLKAEARTDTRLSKFASTHLPNPHQRFEEWRADKKRADTKAKKAERERIEKLAGRKGIRKISNVIAGKAAAAAKAAKARQQLKNAKKSGDEKAEAKAERVLTEYELAHKDKQRDREHKLKLKKLEIAEDRRREREANRKPKKSFSEHYRTAHSNIESTFGHQKSPLEKTKMVASGWATAMQAFIEGFGFLGSALGDLFTNILNVDTGGGSNKEDRQTKMAKYHERLLERKRLAKIKRKELEEEKKQKDEEEKDYQRKQREKREEREHDLKMAKVTGKDPNSESDYF